MSGTQSMTDLQKRTHFRPLMTLHAKHKKIKKEPVVGKVGDLGKQAIAKEIKNGHFNRGKDFNGATDENSIWSVDKKANFILRTIGGTAPLTFFFRESFDEDDAEEGPHLQTYDGANRILAIAEFMSDQLRVSYDGKTFLFSELPLVVQKAFINQKCISLTMSDCSEEFATQYAADLNHGTPMSMGEHLNLLRAHPFPLCRNFDRYAEKYPWSTRGFLGHRSSGIKLIALVMMHIEQNTSDWTEHQTSAVNQFFTTNESVKYSTETDGVLQALDTMVKQWERDEIKIPKKDVPKYIQIMAAASLLFSFYNYPIDQNTFNRLDKITSDIKKYSPSKLVDAYIKSFRAHPAHSATAEI